MPEGEIDLDEPGAEPRSRSAHTCLMHLVGYTLKIRHGLRIRIRICLSPWDRFTHQGEGLLTLGYLEEAFLGDT